MKRFFSIIMAAVLCLGLLTACGSSDSGNSGKDNDKEETMESKLVGTWIDEDGEYRITFKSGGKGSWEGDSFQWKVDSKDTLTITDVGDMTYEYGRDAMDGDEDYWYMKGKTLYLDGHTLTKSEGKTTESKSGTADKLVGTWGYEGTEYGSTWEVKWTFKSNGKGEMYAVYDEETSTENFTWKVNSKDKLTMALEGYDGFDFEWSEDAKDGDDECWYIEGRTLYLDGRTFTKK